MDDDRVIVSSTVNRQSGQELFLENADYSLSVMVEAASKMSVQGVAVVAFIPRDSHDSWISKMKVAGALTDRGANFLAVAYSKAAEMADTHRNSGSRDGEPLHGEFGYQGGVLGEVSVGYILAVFSAKGVAALKRGFTR